MLHSLIAYDVDGNVVAHLDHMVAKDDAGHVIGLIDFEAHESAGGRLRDVLDQSNAVGSATWPEWLGPANYEFQIELDPNPGNARAHIAALVHKKSGHRRERDVIEAEIERRHEEKRAAARAKGHEQRQLLRQRRIAEEIVQQFGDPPPDPVDLRDLLGGPGKPLLLDEDGRTRKRPKFERPNLPVVKKGR